MFFASPNVVFPGKIPQKQGTSHSIGSSSSERLIYSSTCPGSNTTGSVKVTVCVGSDVAVAVDVGLNVAVEVTVGGAIVEEGTNFVGISLTDGRGRHPDNINNTMINVRKDLFFMGHSSERGI